MPGNPDFCLISNRVFDYNNKCFFLCFLAPLGHRNKILREMKKMKAEQQSGLVPDEYLCPITREIMVDPVIASGRISLCHHLILVHW